MFFPKTKRAVETAKSTIQLSTIISVVAVIVATVALIVSVIR